jgi:hypothetical protein
MFFPRQIHLGRIPPLARSLAVAPDETTTRWVLTGDGSADGDVVPEAALGGPAGVLYLLLWGRVPLEDPRVRVEGDAEAAAAVLAARVTP